MAVEKSEALLKALNGLKSQCLDITSFECALRNDTLFLTSSRNPGLRGWEAVSSSIDAFAEGKITGALALSRIRIEDLQQYLLPTIAASQSKPCGVGMGSSPGAAVGQVAFSLPNKTRARSKIAPAILVCRDLERGHFSDVEFATHKQELVGIVATMGGMTSHASLHALHLGIPCVSGLGWAQASESDFIDDQRQLLQKGDTIALDGRTGCVFRGTPPIVAPSVKTDIRLEILVALVEWVTCEETLPRWYLGEAWAMRDMVLRSSEPETSIGREGGKNKQRTNARLNEPAGKARQELITFARTRLFGQERREAGLIWGGMRTTLFRMLRRASKQNDFHQFLFDPDKSVFTPADCCDNRNVVDGYIQVVAEEFSSINRWVPELLEFASIRICAALGFGGVTLPFRTRHEDERTSMHHVVNLKIVVNNVEVSERYLPAFYNYLRRKELFWKWYEHVSADHEAVLRELRDAQAGKPPKSWRYQLQRAGLLNRDGTLSPAGMSAIQPKANKTRGFAKITKP